MYKKPTFRTVIRNGEIVREAITTQNLQNERTPELQREEPIQDEVSGVDISSEKSFLWKNAVPILVLSCLLIYAVGRVNSNYGLLLACMLLGLTIPFIGFSSRKSGLSSYSIFNPNFQRLDGQLRSKQFEAEIRHQQFNDDDDDD
jgi:hypothetical protein